MNIEQALDFLENRKTDVGLTVEGYHIVVSSRELLMNPEREQRRNLLTARVNVCKREEAPCSSAG